MTAEHQGADPYEAVIADLTAKRDQLDNLINALVAFRNTPTTLPGFMMPAAMPAPPPNEEPAGVGPGAFLGMSIVDAAKKLLAARKRAMTNSEILAEITKGGLVLTGADPLNVVGSVLTRRFKNEGDVVRVSRGTWGLKEWYPNRSFKTVGKNAGVVIETISSDGTPTGVVVSAGDDFDELGLPAVSCAEEE